MILHGFQRNQTRSRPLMWGVLICCFGLGLSLVLLRWLGKLSLPMGWGLLFFAAVIGAVEAVYWASTGGGVKNLGEGFYFPPVSLELDPQPLLLAEFEYARDTANQAISDRNTMVSFYLLVFSIIVGAVVNLLTFENGHHWFIPPFCSALLLWGLVVIGWLLYLMLIRLRQAWDESLLAMNQIKAFFVAHAGETAGKALWTALRWRPGTIPALNRKWNINHYAALLLNLLNGVAFSAGTLLIDPTIVEHSATGYSALAMAVLLGVGVAVYGTHMFNLFLKPASPSASETVLAPDCDDWSMRERVQVLYTECVYDGFFKIDRATLRYPKFDGTMSAEFSRSVFERGDSLAVLAYDRENRKVVLVKQFRYPAYVRDGPGWLWEIIAGMQDVGREAEDVVRSEALEEAGYQLGELEYLMTVYPSPGGSSERLHIYLAAVTQGDRVAEDGGLDSEDILVRTFDLDEALQMIEDGRIVDGKTVLALEHLALHWDEM